MAYPVNIKSVATGGFGTWATDINNDIYFINGDSKWEKVNGKLVQVSVTADTVWGVDPDDKIYYTQTAGPLEDWTQTPGSLKQISADENGIVWGINSSGAALHYTGLYYGWQVVTGVNQLRQISSGPSGVWTVKTNGDIYYRVGSYGETDARSIGTAWLKVNGAKNWVQSGPGWVYGCNSAGNFEMKFTNKDTPTGGSWISWSPPDGTIFT